MNVLGRTLSPCFCTICYKNCATCSEEEEEVVQKLLNKLGRYCYRKTDGRGVSVVDKKLIFRLIERGILGICQACLETGKEFCALYDEFKRDMEPDVFLLNWKLWTIQHKMEEAYKHSLESLRQVLSRKDDESDFECLFLDEDEDMDTGTFRRLKMFKMRLIEKCSRKLLQSGPKVYLTNCSAVPGNHVGTGKNLQVKKKKKIGGDGGVFMCQRCKKIYMSSGGLNYHLAVNGCQRFVQNHKVVKRAGGRPQKHFKKPTHKQEKISKGRQELLTLRKVDIIIPNLELNVNGESKQEIPIEVETTVVDFECRTCGQLFNDFETWEAHNIAGHPVPKPICEECGECCYQSRADWIFGIKRCRLN